MALTASLSLDIKAFERGLLTAEAELRTFSNATKSVDKDLRRMLEDFSGEKVRVEAALMAEAVARIGGASKLTEVEQAKLNATVTAAINKYHALGQEAPNDLLLLQQETAKANTGTSTLLNTVGRMAAAFSVANLIDRGVSALFSFGAAAIKGASDLVDLNQATAVSIETLQRWGHIADQGGIQLDDMTTAAFKLGAKLDGGGSSVREAVERLGVAWTTLKGLKPEQQMDEILKAAELLGPTQERNAVLTELFGSRGAQALARIVEGYESTGRAASVASDEQVKALSEASNAWSKFIKDIGTGFTQAMGTAVMAARALGSGINDLTDEERNQIAFLKKSGGDFGAYIKSLEALRVEQAAAAAAAAAAGTQSTAATKDYVAALAALQKAVDDVVKTRGEELAAAVKVGASTEEITRQFGLSEEAQKLYASSTKATVSALNTADDFTARWNDSLSTNATKAKEAAEELKRFVAATNTKLQFSGDTFGDMTKLLEQRFTGPIVAALISNVKAHTKYQHELDELTDKRTLSRLEAEIQAIDRWAKDQKAALDTVGDAWKQSADDIDALTAARKKAAIQDNEIDAWIEWNKQLGIAGERMRALAKAARDDTASSLRELSGALADLSQIAGDSGGLGKVAELIGSMSLGATAGNQFGDALASIGKEGKSTAGSLLKMAAAAASAATALAKATSEGTRAQRVFSGLATGASIGSAFGPWGTAIGGAVGGLIGLFRSTTTAAKDVETVVKEWPQILAEGTDESGRLTAELIKSVSEMRKLGTATKEVQEYMRGQASSALEGFNAVAAGVEQWGRYGDAVKKATDERQKALDDGSADDTAALGSKEWEKFKRLDDELTNALREQMRVSEGAKAGLADLGIQALAAFNAATASGLSFSEALRQIAPGMGSLMKAYRDLGINIDDTAVKALAMQSSMLEKNPALINGISGLAQSFIALGNLGLLNTDTFAAMQRTAMDFYTRIQGEVAAMGGSTRDALLPMQQYLQEAAEQAKLLGVPLDANTQMLIDQSKELGIWKDKGKPPMEEMRDAVLEMRDAIKELIDEFKRVPSKVDTEVTTRYRREGEPAPGLGGTGAEPRVSPDASMAAMGGVDRAGAITVPVYLDGFQIAMAVAPHRNAANRRWGV